ncbi:hypothetical protein [Halomonas llamarensis]|uniref:Uncharacterized protein n=1 Tax=Halomonas llamarensis TaxID=2945104 RepID=A0ABT0SUV7_9GAMM|nr:hypothetical protein [Halomonas llamarensis]MCL7931608.1 hypothetical protein [Halomonas llamarensis]
MVNLRRQALYLGSLGKRFYHVSFVFDFVIDQVQRDVGATMNIGVNKCILSNTRTLFDAKKTATPAPNLSLLAPCPIPIAAFAMPAESLFIRQWFGQF